MSVDLAQVPTIPDAEVEYGSYQFLVRAAPGVNYEPRWVNFTWFDSFKVSVQAEYNTIATEVRAHMAGKDNPHATTADQVGALPINGGAVTGATSFTPSLRIKAAATASGYGSLILATKDDAVGFTLGAGSANSLVWSFTAPTLNITGAVFQYDRPPVRMVNNVAYEFWDKSALPDTNILKTDGTSLPTKTIPMGKLAASTTADMGNVGLLIQNGGTTTTSEIDVAAIGFVAGNAKAKLYFRPDGFIGVGGGSYGSWRWYVNLNTGDTVSAGNLGSLSDRRLKEEIRTIFPSEAMQIVRELSGVRFKWSDSEVVGKPGSRDVGLIAQEVAEVLPEAMGDKLKDPCSSVEYDTVAYSKLIPVLLQAIKDLDDRLSALESKKRKK